MHGCTKVCVTAIQPISIDGIHASCMQGCMGMLVAAHTSLQGVTKWAPHVPNSCEEGWVVVVRLAHKDK